MNHNILKTNTALYLFLIISSAIGWLASGIDTKLLKKLSPLSLIIIDAFLVLMILLVSVPIYLKGDFSKLKKEISSINLRELMILLFIALIIILIELSGTYLLSLHGVGKIGINSYIINVAVSAIGIYLLMSKKLSLIHIIGFIMMAIGGYLFSR